jgi:DNA topoisomerase VI subunit A
MDPWSLYIYAMKAPMTRDRYQTRLAKFLTFIGVAGSTVQEQSRAFAKMGKDDSIWALNSVLKFVQFQKDRYPSSLWNNNKSPRNLRFRFTLCMQEFFDSIPQDQWHRSIS